MLNKGNQRISEIVKSFEVSHLVRVIGYTINILLKKLQATTNCAVYRLCCNFIKKWKQKQSFFKHLTNFFKLKKHKFSTKIWTTQIKIII